MKNKTMKKLSPIKNYPAPKYPTKIQIIKNPALLRKAPRRWRASPIAGAALLFVLSSGLYACASEKFASPEQVYDNGDISDGKDVDISEERVEALSIPLFEHGSGRSSYGCVSVAPPVYLSEEEAAQVVREEALKMGVDFSSSAKLTSDRFPSTNLYGTQTDAVWSGEMMLDGYDEKLGIGFEFVSKEDVNEWEKQDENVHSTVTDYDMNGTAERLSAVVNNTVVFYDPGTNYELIDYEKLYSDELGYSETEERLRADSIENLREQVRSFLEWLAAEGII